MKRPAFGLAETLLASMMIAFTLVGLYGITTSISRANEANMKRVTASALAEEAIELIRYQHDRYWIGGRDQTGAPFTVPDKVDFFTYLKNFSSGVAGVTASTYNLVWEEAGQPISPLTSLMQIKDINGILTQLADPLGTTTYQRTLTVSMYKDAKQPGAAATPWDELRHIDSGTGIAFTAADLGSGGATDIKKDLLKVTAEVKWHDAAGHEQSYVSSTFVTNWLEGIL